MHLIENIIEPKRLLLAWQAPDENQARYIVGELYRINDEISLSYLPNTNDFIKAQKHGFDAYPAFKDTNKTHHNVLDAFMRRLPPRTRGDFPQYLEGLRLKSDVKISNFGLLGYSGAKLLSDDFSIIHPFDYAKGPCELFIEAAGYRHLQNQNKITIQMGQPISFTKEFNNITQEEAIRINVDGMHIGYVNRGLIPTFLDWMKNNRIEGAWVEKINGNPGKPAIYLYIKIQ